MTPPKCCTFWDGNSLVAETVLMALRRDMYPVTPGHMLIIPKRHVDRLTDLTTDEFSHIQHMLSTAYAVNGHGLDYTVGVNDGVLAGRTIAHLHVHVIPRRAGDVADPRGGVRRLLIADPGDDPWLTPPTDEERADDQRQAAAGLLPRRTITLRPEVP